MGSEQQTGAAGKERPTRRPSEVAEWHRLSGLPDNVTGAGEIIDAAAGRRQQVDKDGLRSEIERLSAPVQPARVRGMARLAASYLLAGDVETARRCIQTALDILNA